MYIESIEFKRYKTSEWERGYYVGETDNCKNSVKLDAKYQPILDKLWDYRTDTDNWIQIRCNENDIK
ncbi:MAG TPA: hypothetical protein GXZ90_09865 [Clostridiales bacterium]|nr:hypothetical protein [Clostridiales bacterium]